MVIAPTTDSIYIIETRDGTFHYRVCDNWDATIRKHLLSSNPPARESGTSKAPSPSRALNPLGALDLFRARFPQPRSLPSLLQRSDSAHRSRREVIRSDGSSSNRSHVDSPQARASPRTRSDESSSSWDYLNAPQVPASPRTRSDESSSSWNPLNSPRARTSPKTPLDEYSSSGNPLDSTRARASPRTRPDGYSGSRSRLDSPRARAPPKSRSDEYSSNWNPLDSTLARPSSRTRFDESSSSWNHLNSPQAPASPRTRSDGNSSSWNPLNSPQAPASSSGEYSSSWNSLDSPQAPESPRIYSDDGNSEVGSHSEQALVPYALTSPGWRPQSPLQSAKYHSRSQPRSSRRPNVNDFMWMGANSNVNFVSTSWNSNSFASCGPDVFYYPIPIYVPPSFGFAGGPRISYGRCGHCCRGCCEHCCRCC